MQVWCLHNAVRYVFVPTEGPVVLFDFHNCAHLSAGNEVVSEVRPAVGWFYFAAGKDRKSVGSGKSVSVRVVIGGRRRFKKQRRYTHKEKTQQPRNQR